MGIKKRMQVKDIMEIQRGRMYRGLSLFGYKAFILYKKSDGSTGYFEMSENLYHKETMTALFRKLIELNRNIKIDPYYKKLIKNSK